LVSSARVAVRKRPPPPPPPPPALVGISIEPDTVTLAPNQAQLFLARARYADGSLQQVSPTWGASLGTMGSDGQYQAPGTAGVYRIFAIFAAAGGVASDTALVTVPAPPGPPPPPPPPTPPPPPPPA